METREQYVTLQPKWAIKPAPIKPADELQIVKESIIELTVAWIQASDIYDGTPNLRTFGHMCRIENLLRAETNKYVALIGARQDAQIARPVTR